MRRPLTALVLGSGLALSLLALPAGAAAAPAKAPALAAERLGLTNEVETEGFSETKILKPRGKKAAAARNFSAAAADEFCEPVIERMTNTPVNLPVGISATRTIDYAVEVYDPCDVLGSMYVSTWNQAGTYVDGWMDWTDVDGMGTWLATSYYPVSPYDIWNTDAGTWDWDVTGYDYGDTFAAYDMGRPWNLQRWTTMTNNATEPHRKGTTITITGNLARANWDVLRYTPYTNQTVSIQQRPYAGGPFTTVKTAVTDSRGIATAKVTAVADACFRVVYAGKSIAAPVTPGSDCVDVY